MIFRIYDSKRMDMYIQTIRQNQLARFRNVSWHVYIIYLFIPCRCRGWTNPLTRASWLMPVSTLLSGRKFDMCDTVWHAGQRTLDTLKYCWTAVTKTTIFQCTMHHPIMTILLLYFKYLSKWAFMLLLYFKYLSKWAFLDKCLSWKVRFRTISLYAGLTTSFLTIDRLV